MFDTFDEFHTFEGIRFPLSLWDKIERRHSLESYGDYGNSRSVRFYDGERQPLPDVYGEDHQSGDRHTSWHDADLDERRLRDILPQVGYVVLEMWNSWSEGELSEWFVYERQGNAFLIVDTSRHGWYNEDDYDEKDAPIKVRIEVDEDYEREWRWVVEARAAAEAKRLHRLQPAEDARQARDQQDAVVAFYRATRPSLRPEHIWGWHYWHSIARAIRPEHEDVVVFYERRYR